MAVRYVDEVVAPYVNPAKFAVRLKRRGRWGEPEYKTVTTSAYSESQAVAQVMARVSRPWAGALILDCSRTQS